MRSGTGARSTSDSVGESAWGPLATLSACEYLGIQEGSSCGLAWLAMAIDISFFDLSVILSCGTRRDLAHVPKTNVGPAWQLLGIGLDTTYLAMLFQQMSGHCSPSGFACTRMANPAAVKGKHNNP